MIQLTFGGSSRFFSLLFFFNGRKKIETSSDHVLSDHVLISSDMFFPGRHPVFWLKQLVKPMAFVFARGDGISRTNQRKPPSSEATTTIPGYQWYVTCIEYVYCVFIWLVVEPTHLKNMRTSNWIISPKFRGENKKYLSCHHLVCVYIYILIYHMYAESLKTQTP